MHPLTCAILCNDVPLSAQIEEHVHRTPFLALQGIYQHPVEALSAYYENPIQVYFIHIEHGEIDSFKFCQWLKPSTHVIFIAEDKEYAADCFRLNALDYLISPISYPIFLEAVSKALRWEGIPMPQIATEVAATSKAPTFIFIKSEYRMIRVNLAEINYIESMGDYVKIHFTNDTKPIMSLCSLKNIEQMLSGNDFIRVHRSYIVRKDNIKLLEHGNIIFDKVSIPIGESYRKQFQEFFSQFPIL